MLRRKDAVSCFVSERTLCPLSAVLRARLTSHVWLMARSEQLRQLAVQLASLETLEDVVTHGLQSLLESPSRLVAPISSVEQGSSAALLRPRSRSRSPLPKAPLGRSRGSILLSQRWLKSCPRLFPTVRSPPTAAPAPRPLPLATSSLGAGLVRPAPPLGPSLASWLLIPVRLPPGRVVELALQRR